jgi:hypothetical protein
VVSKSDVGIAGPWFDVPLERGKIREFARAIKADLPEYMVESKPYIPPTFLVTAGRFWGYTFDDPGETALAQVSIDRSILLHAEEEYEFFGPPPRAGTTLRARTKIADVYEKEGRRGGKLVFVVSETEFQDESGRSVAVSRTTVVKTESAPVTNT